MTSIVTLTTDFGPGSPYVAQMKGVLLTLTPAANIVDVSHGVRPQNVLEGAVVLDDVVWRFPLDTLHVAVIDPGVGTARRIIYVEAGGQRFLAPDNGLLGLVLRRYPCERAFVLTERKFWLPQVSNTFHGRDVFAPVAARLLTGLSPASLGPATTEWVPLAWPRPEVTNGVICGEVIYSDAFGNLLTNLSLAELPPGELTIECNGRTMVGLQATYGNASPGTLFALADSQGRLEIAVVNGNAAHSVGSGNGDESAGPSHDGGLNISLYRFCSRSRF